MHHAHIDYRHRHAATRPAWRLSVRLLVWILFLVGCLLVTLAGLASAPGCSSTEQAGTMIELAARKDAELKARQDEAAAKNDAATVAAIQIRRDRIDASVAAVLGAQQAKAAPEETAAAAAAAGVVGGPAAAAITAGLALVGHLWRTSRLRDAVADLRRNLDDGATATADIVNSIENAKDTHPEFAAAFEKAAPTIRARQNALARHTVDLVAVDRQRRRRSVRGALGTISKATTTPLGQPASDQAVLA